ncbi:ncs1 nucleoside transporter family protein [Diplodia corticola]|uniref:Ncs1 nucleoside transporter family protein n=1 Tax=Diplodia corticola TaxID=236234 RepID=A0A1J9S2U1_9PEZI|nr:ncs1 nucleoside transporter family protein [Diplodia corticola]OJD34324.1 ncs1 nucleoside transporter family protein [Diplodia corticola]
MGSEKPKGRLAYWAKRLECPVDENANYKNTFWALRDTGSSAGKSSSPIVVQDTDQSAFRINTTAWTAGSSLLSLGLSVPQAMGVVVGVALISALIAVFAGWPGSHLYLGFTVLSRASWGMRGGFWPVLNRIMTACVWMGIQAYWGGQAVKIILRALIGRSFIELKNTLPATANTDTASLISFFVFIAIFLPLPLIPPEKLQLPFKITFVMITATMFGMLGWAVRAAGGSAGGLVHAPATQHGAALRWAAAYGLQSIVGSQASGCLGQSDWTRYARAPHAALLGQLVAAPVFIVVTAVCGILITSAAATVYGRYVWNPFELLLLVQEEEGGARPAARAGTFFAGLGFLVSQLALCQMLNGISTGMDMAALCPKWINIRRGCYILTVIAIAICPWNYVTNPGTFITVLSGWSVFLSPMTAIVICDYALVRRGPRYRVSDLYRGDASSAYWYVAGFNPRAFVAWIAGMAPLLPGFARAVKGVGGTSGWDRVYQVSYFYGFGATFVVYWALFAVWPVEGQRECGGFVLEGVAEMVGVEGEGVEDDRGRGSGSGSGSAGGRGGAGEGHVEMGTVDGKEAAKTFAE